MSTTEPRTSENGLLGSLEGRGVGKLFGVDQVERRKKWPQGSKANVHGGFVTKVQPASHDLLMYAKFTASLKKNHQASHVVQVGS